MALMQWLKNLFSPRASTAGASGVKKLPNRNEPCWCGSRKKYKQCHLRKDTEERIEAGYAALAAQMAARNAGKNVVTGGGKSGGSKAKPTGTQDYKDLKRSGKSS